MSVNGVIEVFIKGEDDRCHVGATFLDDDNNVAFINKIFPEAMMDFMSSSGDPIKVARYDLQTIENRMFLNPNLSIQAERS